MIANNKGNLAYQSQESVNPKVKTIKKVKKRVMPAGEKIFYLFAVIFIAGLASVVISGYAQIAEYNYSIQKIKNSIVEINKYTDQLQIEIAELSSPERIIDIAQNKLGMTLNEKQVIVLSR